MNINDQTAEFFIYCLYVKIAMIRKSDKKNKFIKQNEIIYLFLFYKFIFKMTETRKQEMLKKLEDLKMIVVIPKLYLANYFQELRNNVDKQMFPKQILHYNDNEEMKNELNQIWVEMISKIDSFEKECNYLGT